MSSTRFSAIIQRMRIPTLFILGLLSAATPLRADVQVGHTSQLSLSYLNQAPAGPSGEPAISPNGRYVAFTSRASDIISGQTDNAKDVFVRDLKTSSVSKVSVNTAGTDASGDSANPSISPILPDGTYVVAFESVARNLGSDPNLTFASHIFLRYPKLGITEVLTSPSVSPGLPGANTHPSVALLRDSKGDLLARVAYVSAAADLEPGDTNQLDDIYVTEFKLPKSTSYDRATQVLLVGRVLPNSATANQEPDGPSESPQISGDGEHVVFASTATNLLTGSPSGISQKQIYVVDRTTRTVKLVSKNSNGDPADADCYSPSINYNGRYITYLTTATNIVTLPNPESYTAIRYDTKTGVSERINASTAGEASDGVVTGASISANGRLVIFTDTGGNLVTPDSNSQADVFLKDMDTGKLSRISVGPSGVQANQFSETPVLAGSTFSSLSLSGVYASYADNLTSPSTSTGLSDIYMTPITLDPPPFSEDTSIDVPPDVKVGSKTLTFSIQKFVIPQGLAIAAVSNRLAVRYQFEITKKSKVGGKSRTTRANFISKKNSYTLAKTKGTYTVRSRVLAIKASTGKVQFKTGFSPRQRFTVS